MLPSRILTTLRTTPRIRESRLVNVKLRLSKSTSANRSTRIRHLLQRCLCRHERVDQPPEGSVFARCVLVNERFEDEGGVADPCVEVVGVGGARTGDDYACLRTEST